jgi:spore germination protein GerM
LLSGCGLPPDNSPQLLTSADEPRGARATPKPTASGTARALVYLIHDGVLVAVARAVPSHPTPAAVLEALLAGPTVREQDAGLISAATAATVTGPPYAGTVTVEVPAPDASSSGRTDEVAGFGQIVLSLTSLPGITAVRFTRDGQALAVPRADGSLNPGPATRRDYADLL